MHNANYQFNHPTDEFRGMACALCTLQKHIDTLVMINVNAPPQVNINMIKCLWQCCLFKIHYIGVQCVVKWVTDDQIFTNRINVSCVYIGEFLSVCEMLIRRLHCTTLDKMCGKLHYFPSKDAYIYNTHFHNKSN